MILDGLTGADRAYVATVRIVNDTSHDIGVALLSQRSSEAEGFLSDANGGSCQLIANGDSWGTLGGLAAGYARLDGGRYSLVPANGQARHVLVFNKRRCESLLRNTSNIVLSVTFVVSNGDRAFTYPVSFAGLTMR